MEKLCALVLIISPTIFCVPDSPAINNIDSWLPVKYEQGQEHPLSPVSSSWKNEESEIFVGISHYRDSRCSATLNNLFSKAKYPDRVLVGIAQQIHTEKDDFDCIRDYCKQFQQKGEVCKHRQQINIIEFTHQDARGTSYARYQQQSMIQDEEFCMQVDAHSDFVQDWDVSVTNMWGSINNEYAVISSATPDISVLRDPHLNDENQQVPHLCQATFDNRGMIVNLPPTAAIHLTSPILSPLYSAGFSFSKCHAEKKVPNDPNLQLIFDADEFTRYARLWTRGYDVYTPNKIIVAHDYEHKMSRVAGGADNGEHIPPTEWISKGMTPDFTRSLYDASVKRIATLLGFPEGDKDVASLSLLTNYGLGDKRSLDQLIEFTGIDTRTKVVYGDRCKELAWVPFTADKDPYTLDRDVWGDAPEILNKGGANVPLVSSGAVELLPESLFSESLASINARRRRAQAGEAEGVDSGSKPNLRAGKNGGVVFDPIVIDLKSGKGLANTGKQVLNRAEEQLVEEFRHRGKELWWVFQTVDTAVEALMNHIDEEVGMGHGHRVVKLILLVLPIFVLVLGAAIWVLISGNSDRIFDTNHKRI